MEYFGLPSARARLLIPLVTMRILLACSKVERKSRGAADSDQERDGKTDRRKRIGYICSGVPEIADTLTDEDLVYDII